MWISRLSCDFGLFFVWGLYNIGILISTGFFSYQLCFVYFWVFFEV